jgi:hypothetical protein
MSPVCIQDDQCFVLENVELRVRRTTTDWSLASTFLDRSLLGEDHKPFANPTKLAPRDDSTTSFLDEPRTTTRAAAPMGRIPKARLIETLLLFAAALIGLFLILSLLLGAN